MLWVFFSLKAIGFQSIIVSGKCLLYVEWRNVFWAKDTNWKFHRPRKSNLQMQNDGQKEKVIRKIWGKKRIAISIGVWMRNSDIMRNWIKANYFWLPCNFIVRIHDHTWMLFNKLMPYWLHNVKRAFNIALDEANPLICFIASFLS